MVRQKNKFKMRIPNLYTENNYLQSLSFLVKNTYTATKCICIPKPKELLKRVRLTVRAVSEM